MRKSKAVSYEQRQSARPTGLAPLLYFQLPDSQAAACWLDPEEQKFLSQIELVGKLQMKQNFKEKH